MCLLPGFRSSDEDSIIAVLVNVQHFCGLDLDLIVLIAGTWPQLADFSSFEHPKLCVLD